jgi:hypothetical protein
VVFERQDRLAVGLGDDQAAELPARPVRRDAVLESAEEGLGRCGAVGDVGDVEDPPAHLGRVPGTTPVARVDTRLFRAGERRVVLLRHGGLEGGVRGHDQFLEHQDRAPRPLELADAPPSERLGEEARLDVLLEPGVDPLHSVLVSEPPVVLRGVESLHIAVFVQDLCLCRLVEGRSSARLSFNLGECGVGRQVALIAGLGFRPANGYRLVPGRR